MNRVKVLICGKEYTLQTDEEPSYVFTLARKLEKNIAELVGANSNLSVYSASVRIALSTLDEMHHCSDDNDNLRTQLKNYADEASRARLERDSALREVEQLKNRIAELEGKSRK
ncbi:MAG: cell division protein ZapA [Oscillospiraceae bacterium]|nr:cell division protein ZapA [Oscillospiraceae bacterium]